MREGRRRGVLVLGRDPWVEQRIYMYNMFHFVFMFLLICIFYLAPRVMYIVVRCGRF